MRWRHHTLIRETLVRRDLMEVWKFFSEPRNLARITPPALDFRITTEPPIAMRGGTLIDYTIRLFGFRVRWRTRISEWQPSAYFVDEQIRGPYRRWVHHHSFRPVPEGTLVHDKVCYQLPLFPLGELAYPIVRYQLNGIFAYRQRQIEQLLH